MRDMNLLPPEYRRKSLTLKHVLIFLLLVAFIWPITKYGFLEPVRKEKENSQQLTALQEDIKNLPDLDEQCMNQQNTMEVLQQRVLAFAEMEENTPLYWQGVLNGIIEDLPIGSTLKQFTCDSNTILLSGSCLNDKVSATYLRNLMDRSYFSEVRIEKIVYQYSDEVTYTIRCTLCQEKMEGTTP